MSDVTFISLFLVSVAVCYPLIYWMESHIIRNNSNPEYKFSPLLYRKKDKKDA